MFHLRAAIGSSLLIIGWAASDGMGADPVPKLIAKPELFRALTEPPCSYCSTQHRKGFVRTDDRVVAWLRAAHNGGAIPVRHYLSASRIINDTYGLFFYDPDGDYVAAFQKDYGYSFHGWRNGVMVVKGRDGTLWSALSGRAIEGPQQGKRLTRIPSMVTEWGYWLMLHPESTAYDLFDGKKYPQAELPTEMSAEARSSMGNVDPRMSPTARILGVEIEDDTLAVPLPEQSERACYLDQVGGKPVAIFWYAPTRTAVAYIAELDGKPLTLFADKISPESAPFKDRETGTRWSLAGRGIDGPLRGRELTWANSIQCRWFAWCSEFSKTRVQVR